MGLRAAKRRQPARALTRDQRAQSLVHECGLLLHAGGTARLRHQFVVQNQRRSHMHQYGCSMHIRQRGAEAFARVSSLSRIGSRTLEEEEEEGAEGWAYFADVSLRSRSSSAAADVVPELLVLMYNAPSGPAMTSLMRPYCLSSKRSVLSM